MSANNSLGESVLSPANTVGATICQIPSQMNPPVLVSRTIDSITIQWAALIGTNTGNSPIISYDLRWDSASGQTIYQLTDSLVTNYTVTGLTGGFNYTFKVRA